MSKNTEKVQEIQNSLQCMEMIRKFNSSSTLLSKMSNEVKAKEAPQKEAKSNVSKSKKE